ncbi:MAG: histidine phosphatase family protein [Alphaproteobacteria bacterium]|nr:histidine phosphatase family protein [Alphaproteobacteria bacterium]
MQKEFYVFRHGQTDMNVAGRWQGQGIDLPLNEIGCQQAQELAEQLKQTGIEVIFSSPLKRAVQTAQIVAETLDIPVKVEQGLIEGCFGAAEGKTKQEINALYPQTAVGWHNLEEEFMDVCFDGGETKRQIQNRILKTLKKIAAENDQRIIGISAHSAVIRCFILLFGLKLYTVPHGRPFHLCFKQDKFELFK